MRLYFATREYRPCYIDRASFRRWSGRSTAQSGFLANWIEDWLSSLQANPCLTCRAFCVTQMQGQPAPP
jgi:hypothetical protein